MRKDVRENSQDTKVSEEARGGGAQDAEAETPPQPMEKTMAKQAVPPKTTEDHSGVDVQSAVCGGPHARAVGYALKETAASGKSN